MSTFLERTVRQIMSTPPATTTPDTSLQIASKKMIEEGVTCLIVVMGDPSLGFGVLTQKDIVALLGPETEDVNGLLADVLVADAMTSPSVVVPPGYGLATCLDMMRMLGVRRAPVVEGNELVGLVSIADIFKAAVG